MFRSKTLFVLGAGASSEANLPTGETLKKIIAGKIDIGFEDGYRQSSGDTAITDSIRAYVRQKTLGWEDINPFLEKAWMLRDALPQAISIDNLLDAHRNDEMVEICGKLGIVKSILEAERKSTLYSDDFDKKINFENVSNTWFAKFVKILTENISRDEVSNIFENVSFLNFNYDRCIEQYLLNALQTYYGLPLQDVAGLLKTLKIVHPYGNVGKLPWRESNASLAVPYGSERVNLLEISKSIKTFNEQIHDDSNLHELRNLVQEAEIIVFLGFAFHRQNLELMKPGQPCNAKRVYATALNISNSDCDIIKTDLEALLEQNESKASIEINNKTKCGDLFNEYWRGLTS